MCTAFGASFQVLEFGASQQGTSNAGTAVSDDTSITYFNPAAMQNISKQQSSLAVSNVHVSPRLETLVTTRGGVNSINTTVNDLHHADATIPMLYYVRPISPKMRFGLSFTVPYGVETHYPHDSAARYFATYSSIKTYNSNVALSYQLDPKWSVGGGLNLQLIEAELDSMFAAGGNDVEVKNSGDHWGHGWNVGIQYKPIPAFRVGLSYRSKISHNLTGNTTVEAPSIAAAAVAAGLGLADGPAKVHTTLPEQAFLSMSYDLLPKVKLLADLHWTRWSRIKDINLFFGPRQRLKSIITKYYDTYRWAFGAKYQYNQKVNWKLGVSHDQSPVSSRYRTARIPDNDRMWYSVGFGYQYNNSWKADLAYSFVRVKNNIVDEFDSVLNHRFVGSYKSHATVVGVEVTHAF